MRSRGCERLNHTARLLASPVVVYRYGMVNLKPRNMPSIERIARFWANRCLLHDTPDLYATVGHHRNWTSVSGWDGDDYSEYYERRPMFEGGCPCDTPEGREAGRHARTFCDYGEPSCMSCGQFLGYTSDAIDAPRTVTCERAHIIPRWLGGEDAVSNIVLLCKPCHSVNPEQESRRVYLDWLISRKHLRDSLIQECIARIPESERKRRIEEFSAEEAAIIGHEIWTTVRAAMSLSISCPTKVAELV